ncbi:MAG TPA: hypothetical protein PKW30_03845 [Campylobacterales bacterium]|nr:hypothetical protein [Campylobacterales bacterium]
MHGLYIEGDLAGVEVVASGKLQDGTPYGASVKLKFHLQEKITKMIEGTPIEQNTSRTVVIAISCADNELLVFKNKYDAKIGKDLKLRLEPADNSRFKLLADESSSVSDTKKAS